VIAIRVNFGGFIPLSTVDWRGRSVCTVFLRGCPIRCSYCQNEALQTGEDLRTTDEVMEMIAGSAAFISGVVFSGGEPTLQKDALVELAGRAKAIGLAVGIQTNGFFPATLAALTGKRIVDKVALDYKTFWEGYSVRPERSCGIQKTRYEENVRRSFAVCRDAYNAKTLAEFEVVVTVFSGNEPDVKRISDETWGYPFVLQQGEHKIGNVPQAATQITNASYIAMKSTLQETHPPLTCDELKSLADELGRTVRIRTRELGELEYEGHRSRRPARKRKR